MQINVLITDDHPVFRSGLRNLLETNENIQVIGEANNGLEAIDWVKKENPDVIVMDVSMPGLNGIDATRQILSFAPDTKVLALSIHSGKRYVKDMLSAGAVGYLLKDSAPDELISAILKVANGDMYLSSSITSIALSDEAEDEESGNENILSTKLHRPPVTSDCIIRNNIIEVLEKNIYKPLSLVVAPAGYGKSVIVSQWLESTKALFTWISLDDEHNDLRTFLLYINAAIEKIFPRALENTSVLINASSLPPIKVIAHSLINELDAIEHDFILVLDDYHRIQNDTIHHLMNELLRFPPEHMHLSILTRKDPPLKINSLLLHNRMTEIRMNELSFSENEIQALFQKLFNISLKEGAAKLIQEKTEGWIVGLRMALLNIKSEDDVDVAIANIRGDAWSLSNFLVEEVLLKQPAEVQDLLLITSMFDRFCADLIEDIYSKTHKSENHLSGSEFIHWLVKSNLFIIPLDAERLWFRYHHLIQELLQKRLKIEKSDGDISTFLNQASRWFEKQGLIEEAIHHRLKAGDQNAAIKIIEQHRDAEFNKDKWYVVQQWLAKLPEKSLTGSPNILLTRAWIAHEQYQHVLMMDLLDKAAKLVEQVETTDSLKGEVYYWQGILQYYSGNGELSQQLFEKSRKLVPGELNLIDGQIVLHLNLARYMCGQKEEALNQTYQLIEKAGTRESLFITRVMAGAAFINMFSADLKRLIEEAHRMESFAKKGQFSYTSAFSSYFLGYAYFHILDIDKAIHHLEETTNQRYIHHIIAAMNGMAGLAFVQQLSGKIKEATTTMELLEDFVQDLGKPEYMQVVYSCRGRISLLQDDLASAMNWAELITEEPAPSVTFCWLEVPCITKVRILISEGSAKSLEIASDQLGKLRQISEECRHLNQLVDITVLEVLLLHKKGLINEALEKLKEAIQLAEPGGWIRPFVEAGPSCS